MERATAIRYIRKLRALGINNPSLEESSAAILKARALMEKHGLNESEVQVVASDVNRYSGAWVRLIAKGCAEINECVFINLSNSKGQFYGKGVNPEIAREMFQYVTAAIRRAKPKGNKKLDSQTLYMVATIVYDRLEPWIATKREKTNALLSSLGFEVIKKKQRKPKGRRTFKRMHTAATIASTINLSKQTTTSNRTFISSEVR